MLIYISVVFNASDYTSKLPNRINSDSSIIRTIYPILNKVIVSFSNNTLIMKKIMLKKLLLLLNDL